MSETLTSKLEQIQSKSKLSDEDIDYINSFAKVERHLTQSQFDIVIKAIFKDERPFLKEWIEWHLFVIKGIDHIYLYHNENDPESDRLIQPYIEKGLVTLIHYDHIKKKGIGRMHRKPQHFSNNDCLNRFSHEFNWIIQIDLDEFIVPRGDSNINDIIIERPHAKQFLIPTYAFGANDLRERQPSVIEAYQKRAYKQWDFKSIANKKYINRHCLQESSHFWYLRTMFDGFESDLMKTVRELYIKYVLSNRMSSKLFQINHYYTKSLQDYLERPANARALGGSGSRHSTEDDWLKKNKSMNQIDDLSAINYLKET